MLSPPRDRIFDDLAKELRDGLVWPVLLGIATRTNGVLRLMKALATRSPRWRRLAGVGLKAGTDPVAAVIKTFLTSHGARCRWCACSTARSATAPTFNTPEREAGRVAGVFKLVGQSSEKRGPAQAGETVALGKLDHANTGDTLTAGKQAASTARRGSRPCRGCSLSGRRQGAQGRRQAGPGPHPVAGGRPFDHRHSQSRGP